MHLPDGLLPLPITLGGYAASWVIAAWCIQRLRAKPDPYQEVPRAALLTAAFFVASLIHLPLPPVSVHLILNGLLGVVLGWFAFPAILVGLFLQAVMFGHGGITTLGINALILGLPALAAFGLVQFLRQFSVWRAPNATAIAGFVAGALAVGLSVTLFAVLILSYLPAHLDATLEQQAIRALILAYLPVMLLEGVITAILLRFLLRVQPNMLATP